ncbi:substrate-binding periplasmic protein [Aliamphritea spongicola]|uniref:substrate-binding periplasmic protein n=1 Tax=Aliamphritea spongicola TaxID=707589 RepID=UPI00196AEFB6|nr:transporter substrate-binding domain-containing protein [Aliamphritea spongicola]MBN3562940.1 transporter substrate-binding domain-containing protein [Aliamphritea spongicola]
MPAFSNGTEDNPEQPVARIVVEHWPPWQIADDDKQEQVTRGYAIEIIEELFNRLNVPVKFQYAPWRRALKLIENGRADLLPMVSEHPARAPYMVFTVPVYRDPILLAYSLDTYKYFGWQNWADLKDYSIRAVRGYNYGDNWRDAVQEQRLRVSESATDMQNLQMLAQGRVELTPLLYSNGVSLLKDKDYTNIRFAEKPIFTTVLRFGVSKQSFLVARLPEINIHLNAMKQDGTFARILGPLYRPRFTAKR